VSDLAACWDPFVACSAAEARDACVVGGVSPTDLARASLRRAAEVRAGRVGLDALLWAESRETLRRAAEAETTVGDMAPGALVGVPIVVGDDVATLTLPTTCGSRALDGYLSPFEATAVERLRHAGAVVIAKSRVDEFRVPSLSPSSATARNPVDPSRRAGSGAGGAAAAVASGVVRIAIGGDTGGDVLVSAAWCGVVALKPTYGRVSRHGLVAMAPSLDSLGVIGATLDDVALATDAISGRDEHDSTTSDRAFPPCLDAGGEGVRGMAIGRLGAPQPPWLDPAIGALCERAITVLRDAGAVVEDVALPAAELAPPAHLAIAASESVTSLARLGGVGVGGEGVARRRFGTAVRDRLLLGAHLLGESGAPILDRARRGRSLVADDFRGIFAGGVRVVVLPSVPHPAEPLDGGDDTILARRTALTCSASLVGLPALTIPVGRVRGLPVGLQLLAPHFHERELFAVAAVIERALGAHAHR
jgi:aspartyl-tRNA(Asn)/glutamyl-tRNA(Gln) amidotransferase subunit A